MESMWLVWPARLKSTSLPRTSCRMLCSSRTSAMFTVTSFSMPLILKRLPPYSGMRESTRTTSAAPRVSRRRARLLPMNPSPPVTSTRSPRNDSGIIDPLLRRSEAVGVLDHSLRRLVDRQVKPAEILAHDPQDQQLSPREEHGDDGKERPALGHVTAGQLLDRHPEAAGGAQADEGESQKRAHPQWHHGEADEHAPPEADQLSQRVSGAADLPLPMDDLNAPDVPGAPKRQPVHVRIGPAVLDDLTHERAAHTLEAGQVEIPGLVEHEVCHPAVEETAETAKP